MLAFSPSKLNPTPSPIHRSTLLQHLLQPSTALCNATVARAAALVLNLVLLSPGASAQASQTSHPVQPAGASPRVSVDPRSWAEQCAAREAAVVLHPNSYLRYRMHVVDEKGDQLRDEIETPDGSVARLILRDGHALTPDEDSGERGRLNYMLQNPASFAHHVKNEQSSRKMGLDLLRLVPEAMLWSYAPGQPPVPSHADEVPPNTVPIVLDFQPNPKWNPPSITAQALTGLAGRVWIDPQTQQLIHFEGSLIKPVNIGWGLVAHVYPGATVSVHQARVSSSRWMADHILEQLNARALMLKSIRQKLVYETSAYQTVQPMSYQQAIKLLLDTPLPSP